MIRSLTGRFVSRSALATLVVAASVLASRCPAVADEGMWLFNDLPRKQLQTRHGFTPTYAWHHLQVIRFQALYLAFVACTCGVGVVLGAPFYILWFSRARSEASAGGFPRLPIVGRWQPTPPVTAGAR